MHVHVPSFITVRTLLYGCTSTTIPLTKVHISVRPTCIKMVQYIELINISMANKCITL
jgi:hypothetical protein